MKGLQLAAILSALAIGDGTPSPFNNFNRRVHIPRPKEPTKEDLVNEQNTISAAELKRKRKAEKRLQNINNQKANT